MYISSGKDGGGEAPPGEERENDMEANGGKHTIRKRVVFISALVLVFVGLLIPEYAWQFTSLKHKLIAMENFHDLFDNVLELRRYEKNYLFMHDDDNYQSIMLYLEKIESDIAVLADDILEVTSREQFQRFQNVLGRYNDMLRPHLMGSSVNTEELRGYGKMMVDFSQDLLNYKRELIHKDLEWIFVTFVTATGGFFLFIMGVFHMQVWNMLKRIAFVQKATRDVLKDKFTPLVDNAKKKDEVSDLIFAFNRMVSEIDARQEQLVRSRKLAAIGTFSSGIAHELNNPLNNISLSADTLREEAGDLSEEETREIVDDIIVQTERASEVVKNLLDFSRDKPPKVEPLRIKGVVDGTHKLLANQLMLNSIWLENYIREDLPLIKGDMQKLQQVFVNLFVNAIQAMPDGGLIYVDAGVENEKYVKIIVNDTGPGIPPEKIGRIFDPFFTTKEVGAGTGLGLSIVYGIVRKHGGYVEVRSKVNVGTTFSIYLPIDNTEMTSKDEEDASSYY